jgi:pimeloyl-ACP methyl ester carboxylesterase
MFIKKSGAAGKSTFYLILTAIIILAAGFFILKDYLQPQATEEEHSMQKVISKDGTEIGFIKRGEGPPLILLHGTTAEHSRWLPLIPHFENQFTVYAIDRRGRGGSGDSNDYHLMKEVEDIVAVVESIGEPVFLLGHSYGGLIALEASLLTSNIRRLILYEPPIPTGISIYPPGTPEKMQAFIDKGENEAALEVMLREVVKMPDHEFEMYRQLPAYKKRIGLASTIPREVTVELSYTFDPGKFENMNIPTLLLLGGDSPAVMQKGTELADAALPNSTVVVMPGQQHIAMDTNTELFVQEVTKFLME